MVDKRIEHEIEHGKRLRNAWAGKFWYWETPAGRIRWQRRLSMLTSHITADMHVLEVGCGVGYFTKEIARTRVRLTAIDISPDLLEVARRGVTEGQVDFRVGNAYNLNEPDNTYDSIVGSSVLHHLDVKRALREFARVLKPGGFLLLTEPNMANIQVFLQKNIPVLKRWAGDSPDETAFFRWALKNSFEEHGFTNTTIEPFDFLHPLTPRRLVPLIEKIGSVLERIPIVRETAGSLYIKAEK